VSEELRATAAALDELERALCRDASRVVLTAAPGFDVPALAEALAARVASSLSIVRLEARELSGEDLCARVLERLTEAPGVDPPARLVAHLQGLARSGDGLALLVGGADALPATALHRLGRLAAEAGSGLRLALFVQVDAVVQADVLGELVSRMGVGVQKVELVRSSSWRVERPMSPPGARVPQAEPPRRAARPRRVRPYTTRRRVRGRARRRAIARLAGAIVGAAAGVAFAFAGVDEVGLWPSPRRVERAERVAAPPAAEARSAVETGGPSAESAAASPPEAPAPVRAAADPARETEVAPPAPILVSVNSRPWAHVEIDGRSVGTTPLGDLPLAPGAHHFRLRLADGRTIERRVRVDAVHDHLRFP
jgi:hypothetical protein